MAVSFIRRMSEETSKAVCVPKQDGERIRRLLIDKQLLRTDLKIKKRENTLLLPIVKESTDINGFTITTETFEVLKHTIESYKEIVQIPLEYHEFLPTSFDIIGDILLIKIPKELEEYKKNIGDALLKTQKQVKTVCNIESVSGELRTRSVEVIAGVQKTETIHTEYGFQVYVDVAETYFSPRLASERRRIASLVQDNEVIIDLFTGVAPFPIMIATYAHPKKIIAFDKNPKAVKLAKKNISKNRVLDRVEVFEKDSMNAKEVLDAHKVTADRIIMNLPFDSFRFLPVSFSIMKKNAVIHLYEILHEDSINKRLDSIRKLAKDEQVEIKNITAHKIKTYAPHEFYIGMDITAKKMMPT